MVQAQAADLFRRHVEGRAHDREELNAADCNRRGRVAGCLRADVLRQAEVQDLIRPSR